VQCSTERRRRAATAQLLSLLSLLLPSGCQRDADGGGTGGETDGAATAGLDGTGTGGGATVPDGLDPLSVLPPLAARLNDAQYRFTVLDIFGEDLNDQELQWLPRDIPIEGAYATSAEAQAFHAQYVLGYAYISRSIGERIDITALQDQIAGCEGVDAACLDAFVARLGMRMFRRPLTASEEQVYLDLAATIQADTNTSAVDVVGGIVEAMMQAPQFLYRLERETEGTDGEVRRVDGYELASRLSYFLWQSTPDPLLMEFAAGPAGDGVFDGDAVETQVQRMIADEKFARARIGFWGDYSLASTSGFGSTDPTLVAELRQSLLATLDRLSGVGADPEPLSAIFDGLDYMMTPAVAELAGAESLGEGMRLYDAALADARTGIVTHPAFLAAMGTTSFVGRGVFMSERLLCQHVPPPPPGIAADIMATAQATEGLTPREASEYRFGLEGACVACHIQFEPIAYAFERYDIQGRYALTDDEGRALFSDGVLPSGVSRPEIVFDDAAELLTALASVEDVQRCFVENMAEYGTGRQPIWAGEFLGDATLRFADDGLVFDALVAAIASGEQLHYLRSVAAQ
jgi:hypothetical protein